MSEVNGSSNLGSSGDLYAGPSPRKLHANQQNALKSTGPRTVEGKANSSQNARKHGLTGVQPITKGEGKEDLQSFEEMRAGLYDYWQPRGWQEEHVVERLAGDYWRLLRADRYEAGVVRHFSDHATHDWQLQKTIRFHNQAMGAELGVSVPGVFLGETCMGIDYQVDFLRSLGDQLKERIDLRPDQLKTIMRLFGQPGRGFAEDCAGAWLEIQGARKEGKEAVAAEWLKYLQDAIARRICFLQEKRKLVVQREESDREAHQLTVSLAPWEALDRLSRYTVTISRSIDRAMNQLERLQRMRKEEFTRAPMNVKVAVEEPLPHRSDTDGAAVSTSQLQSASESRSHLSAAAAHDEDVDQQTQSVPAAAAHDHGPDRLWP